MPELEALSGQGTQLGGTAAIIMAAGYFLRETYIWWVKGRTGVEASGASTDYLRLLREDVAMLRKELTLTKRQLAVLEMLAMKAGIDVQAEYAKRNMTIDDLEDSPHEPN